MPWEIVEITYREAGQIDVMTKLLDDVDGRGYSFEDEEDFDDTLQDYLDSGWVSHKGVRPN